MCSVLLLVLVPACSEIHCWPHTFISPGFSAVCSSSTFIHRGFLIAPFDVRTLISGIMLIPLLPHSSTLHLLPLYITLSLWLFLMMVWCGPCPWLTVCGWEHLEHIRNGWRGVDEWTKVNKKTKCNLTAAQKACSHCGDLFVKVCVRVTVCACVCVAVACWIVTQMMPELGDSLLFAGAFSLLPRWCYVHL